MLKNQAFKRMIPKAAKYFNQVSQAFLKFFFLKKVIPKITFQLLNV